MHNTLLIPHQRKRKHKAVDEKNIMTSGNVRALKIPTRLEQSFTQDSIVADLHLGRKKKI